MPLELRKCRVTKAKRGAKPSIESFPINSKEKFNHYGLYQVHDDGRLQWLSDYDVEGKQLTDPYHWKK